MTFSEEYGRYRARFEEQLVTFCAEMDYEPAVQRESMCYSLLSGGKRVRPVLFYAALDALGIGGEERELALALECVHTYSLIHDDLPAMDNDDYRRGRASNHKIYGEGQAILAGDGLLNLAFELALGAAGRGPEHLEAARILAEAAGARGMVAGQCADLLAEGKPCGEEALRFIYAHKTGALLAAPVRMAAAIAGRGEALTKFGEALGELFQLTDDLLDERGDAAAVGKTLGKDRREGKLTCVRVYGTEGAERRADELVRICKKELDGVDGKTGFLSDLVLFVRNRNH